MKTKVLIEVDGKDHAAADAQLHRAHQIVEERQASLTTSGLRYMPAAGDHSFLPDVIVRVRAEKELATSAMAQLRFVVQKGRAVRVIVIFPELSVDAATARDARHAAGLTHSGLSH